MEDRISSFIKAPDNATDTDAEFCEEINARIRLYKAKYDPQSLGRINDTYHSFNELYHHRALLFASIVNMLPPHRVWKAKQHEDGIMFDGMFIVGVDTPTGQATYHYDIDPYWDIFDCQEREFAPHFDGHTPEEALQRIFNLCKMYQVVVKTDR